MAKGLSLVLNGKESGLAGLALIATLIPQSVPRIIAIGALAIIVMSAIISRGRN
jgi:hypothetical protein